MDQQTIIAIVKLLYPQASEQLINKIAGDAEVQEAVDDLFTATYVAGGGDLGW